MKPPAKEPGRLDPDLIRAALPNGATIGNHVLVFEETDSTNDLAAKAGQDGLAEGLVIFAESQRAGRGTNGRQWLSPPHRNLMFSVLLRPPARVPLARWPELTLCTALAVAEAAEELTTSPARIKWPNDVLLGGRKIAGILLESYQRQTPGFVVLGIGVNVLQRVEDFDPAIRETAGSLATAANLIDSDALRRESAAASVLRHLGRVYAAWPDGFAAIQSNCERRGAQPPEAIQP